MQRKGWMWVVAVAGAAAVGCSPDGGDYALASARLDTMEIGIEPVYSVHMQAVNPGPDTFLVLTASLEQDGAAYRDSTGFYALTGDTVETEVVFPEARVTRGVPTFKAALLPRNRR